MELAMFRWVKRIGITVLMILFLASLSGWWLFRQTRVVPEFYQQATQLSHPDTEAGSYQLEANVAKLQQDASKPGSWNASFCEEDINAWLINQLPLKFKQLQTAGGKDPRISIQQDHLLAAARYTDARLDTVISCELHVELTEEPNLLAVHIRNLKAGAVSLPISQFMDGIRTEAAKGGVKIHWDETESGPTALVQVPSEHAGYAYSPVIIESLEMMEGAIILSGHTGTREENCYAPRGPVHQFVTYQHIEKRNSNMVSGSATFPSRR
ncbi:MAG TPA: hypothetical protein DEF45_01035 [Rhodopirellula sp.]|nr:hypothetical protein [Rhodopirellula sp.]